MCGSICLWQRTRFRRRLKLKVLHAHFPSFTLSVLCLLPSCRATGIKFQARSLEVKSMASKLVLQIWKNGNIWTLIYLLLLQGWKVVSMHLYHWQAVLKTAEQLWCYVLVTSSDNIEPRFIDCIYFAASPPPPFTGNNSLQPLTLEESEPLPSLPQPIMPCSFTPVQGKRNSNASRKWIYPVDI